MKPKGGLTLIIAVGGGNAPSHGHSDKQDKGGKMIRLPLDALISTITRTSASATLPADNGSNSVIFSLAI